MSIGSFFHHLGHSIKHDFHKVGHALHKAEHAVVGVAKKAVTGLGHDVVSIAKAGEHLVKDGFKEVGKVAHLGGDLITGHFNKLGGDLVNVGKGALHELGDVGAGLEGAVKTAVDLTPAGVLVDDTGKFGKALMKPFDTIGKGIYDVAKTSLRYSPVGEFVHLADEGKFGHAIQDVSKFGDNMFNAAIANPTKELLTSDSLDTKAVAAAQLAVTVVPGTEFVGAAVTAGKVAEAAEAGGAVAGTAAKTAAETGTTAAKDAADAGTAGAKGAAATADVGKAGTEVAATTGDAAAAEAAESVDGSVASTTTSTKSAREEWIDNLSTKQKIGTDVGFGLLTSSIPDPEAAAAEAGEQAVADVGTDAVDTGADAAAAGTDAVDAGTNAADSSLADAAAAGAGPVSADDLSAALQSAYASMGRTGPVTADDLSTALDSAYASMGGAETAGVDAAASDAGAAGAFASPPAYAPFDMFGGQTSVLDESANLGAGEAGALDSAATYPAYGADMSAYGALPQGIGVSA